MENSKEAKRSRFVNARRVVWAHRIKNMSPEAKFCYDQHQLWHKLCAVFDKVEYVNYDNLPEALQSQVSHFDEFTFPS